MSAQRYDDAERYLRKAVRLNPKSVKANYQLGLLLARMGRKEEADKQLALAKSLRRKTTPPTRACSFACWSPSHEGSPMSRWRFCY